MKKKILAFSVALVGLITVKADAATLTQFVGLWQGSTYTAQTGSIAVSLVIQPDGSYSEEMSSASGLMTLYTGQVQLVSNNLVHFSVVDWEPKQQCLPPSGCVNIPQPPGSMYYFQFTSPTALTFQDANYGGVIQFQQSLSVTQAQVDCLFNWAEKVYPQLFTPAPAPSQVYSVYHYRYYPGSNTYLAVSSSDYHVYFEAPPNGIIDEGAISNWLPQAGCQ